MKKLPLLASALASREGMSTLNLLQQVLEAVPESGITAEEMVGRLKIIAKLKSASPDQTGLVLEGAEAVYIAQIFKTTKWPLIDQGIVNLLSDLIAVGASGEAEELERDTA